MPGKVSKCLHISNYWNSWSIYIVSWELYVLILNFKYYEHLGETSDRGTRQTYKFSHTLRVVLSDREQWVYFEDSVYETVKESNYDFKGKLPEINPINP